MRRDLLKPIATETFNSAAGGGGNITTSAWKEIVASMAKPSAAFQVFNGTGRVLQVAFAASGQEDNNVYPYTILPGGNEVVLPVSIENGVRVAMKAVDADATAGWLVLNFYG